MGQRDKTAPPPHILEESFEGEKEAGRGIWLVYPCLLGGQLLTLAPGMHSFCICSQALCDYGDVPF